MEGGNGATSGSVVTLCLKCAKQNDAAGNLPRMDSALGVLLDGAAVKENAEASKNLFRSAKHPPCGFADILSAPDGGGASPRSRAPANTRSRWSFFPLETPALRRQPPRIFFAVENL